MKGRFDWVGDTACLKASGVEAIGGTSQWHIRPLSFVGAGWSAERVDHAKIRPSVIGTGHWQGQPLGLYRKDDTGYFTGLGSSASFPLGGMFAVCAHFADHVGVEQSHLRLQVLPQSVIMSAIHMDPRGAQSKNLVWKRTAEKSAEAEIGKEGDACEGPRPHQLQELRKDARWTADLFKVVIVTGEDVERSSGAAAAAERPRAEQPQAPFGFYRSTQNRTGMFTLFNTTFIFPLNAVGRFGFHSSVGDYRAHIHIGLTAKLARAVVLDDGPRDAELRCLEWDRMSDTTASRQLTPQEAADYFAVRIADNMPPGVCCAPSPDPLRPATWHTQV